MYRQNIVVFSTLKERERERLRERERKTEGLMFWISVFMEKMCFCGSKPRDCWWVCSLCTLGHFTLKKYPPPYALVPSSPINYLIVCLVSHAYISGKHSLEIVNTTDSRKHSPYCKQILGLLFAHMFPVNLTGWMCLIGSN